VMDRRWLDTVPERYTIQRPGPVDPNTCVQCRHLAHRAEAWRAADGSSSDGLALLRLIRAHRVVGHRGEIRQRVSA
jgi:hypothetical protein